MIELDADRYLYISPRGKRFHLDGGAYVGKQGVNLLPGKTGFEGPALKPITTQGARQFGVTLDGVTVDAGKLDFKVFLEGEPGRGISDVERSWKAAWPSEGPPGWFCAWKRGTGWWWIPVHRLDMKEVSPYTTSVQGHAEYEMSAIAPDPLWRTRAQPFLWEAPAVSTDFVPGYLRVFNRGDRKAYGRYVFNGPGTWRFWDSGRFVTLPALLEGEELRLDTTPGKWTLVDNLGINRWAQLGGQRFREFVPAGESKVIEVGIKNGTVDSQLLFTIEPRSEYLP